MSENTPTHGSILAMMDNLLVETADLTKAATNLDLASDSKSKHPSTSVDDKTKPATEGARSSENAADVRKDVPDNVEESASKNTPGDSKKPTDDQGTISMAADSGLKGNVDTPKKDHSQSMSDSGPGDGSESFKGDWDKASAAELLGEANGILEEISKAAGGAAPAAAEAGSEKVASEDELTEMYKSAAAAHPEAEEAGYAAASMLAQYLLGEQKTATAQSDAYTQVVGDLTKEAEADAMAYANFLRGYQDSMQKAAIGEGGELPPEAMAAMAGGGEEVPPDAAAAGAGGGLDELMGAAGGEGGGEVGGGGEGGDEDAIIEALAEALDEAGVTPEELAEAVAEAEGGGAEAGPEGLAAPGAEGAVPGADAVPPEALAALAGGGGMEAAAATRSAPVMQKAALKAAVAKLVHGK